MPNTITPIARGLRERKKLKTKEAIQREAMRLFQEQGYEETTIDHRSRASWRDPEPNDPARNRRAGAGDGARPRDGPSSREAGSAGACSARPLLGGAAKGANTSRRPHRCTYGPRRG